MPCIGCKHHSLINAGWMPVDANGDRMGGAGSQYLVPHPPGPPGPNSWTLGGANFTVAGSPIQGVLEIPYDQLSSLAGLYNSSGPGDFDFVSSSEAELGNMGVTVDSPGAGQVNDNGLDGECQPDGNPPGCEENEPCIGNAKYRLTLTNAEVEKATYGRTCVGEGGDDDVEPEGDPADPSTGQATPADDNPSPQKPIGTAGNTVAIEVPYPHCYCNASVTVTLKDGNGDSVTVEDQSSGQRYQLAISIFAICTVCGWQNPPPPPGACCFEVDHEVYCQDVANENACDDLVDIWEGELIAFYEGETCEDSECEGIEPPELH